MARPSLISALLALVLCAAAARAASDCRSLPGCAACSYQLKNEAAVLTCTACQGSAYALKAASNRCDCAPGHFSRLADGTKTGRCDPVPAGFVSAGGAINDTASTARACLANSAPDANTTQCLCAAGYYVAAPGLAPQCAFCNGTTAYTDTPSARTACKLCKVGEVATANRTACVPLAAAPNNITIHANQTTRAAARANRAAARANQTTLAARANLPTALKNATARANATLAGLRNPMAAAKKFNLTAFEARLNNLTASLNPLNRRPISNFNFSNTAAVSKLLNATAASEVNGLWATLQARGLKLPNISSLVSCTSLTPALVAGC
jgi:hypothetical protein